MTQKIPFESEYILHQLTQKHLKELFGLKLAASEKQLNKQRVDNLAFDKKKLVHSSLSNTKINWT